MKNSTFKPRVSPLKRTTFKPGKSLQRGSTRMKSSKPQATAAEKSHMARVAAIGCILCRYLGHGKTPCAVHHLRTGMGKMRAPNHWTLGLCPPHHQFSGYGVHDIGRQQFADRYGISEVELLVMVLDLLDVDTSKPEYRYEELKKLDYVVANRSANMPQYVE